MVEHLQQKKNKLHMEKEYIERLIRSGSDDLSLFRRLNDIDREVAEIMLEIVVNGGNRK